MARRPILIVFLLLLCYAYVPPRWADWSQTSRLALVRALVEQGTVRIDDYVETTGDYALVDGHAYSDKAPGPALLATLPYAALQPLLQSPPVQRALSSVADNGALAATARADGAGLGADRVALAIAHYAVTLIVIALPVALALAAFDALLRRWFRPGPALLGTLGLGLATPLAPYAANLYSHALVAALLIGAWVLLEQTRDTHDRNVWRWVISGALLGFVVISEYPAASIVGVFGVFAIWRFGWRAAGWMVVGGLPAMALLVAYDLAAFGTPWPVGYAYSALWQEQHQTGFLSLTFPRPAALWGLLGGSFRGLWVRAPWLLLALPGAVLWWPSRQYRSTLVVAIASAIGLWLIYSSSRMWWGGFAAGPRYIVAAIPFAALPAVWIINRWWDDPRLRALTIGLVGLSAILVWAESLAGQQFPPDTIANPWLGWTLPAWQDGNIARNVGMALGLRGAWSVLPLLVGGALLLLPLIRTSTPKRPVQLEAAHALG